MLAIKKRFPTREIYLVTGIIASIGVAGALAAIVSAHSLKDQSAVIPTKVVNTNDNSKESPAPQKAVEVPAKEYSDIAAPRKVNNMPAVSTPSLAPSPSLEPTPSVSPDPNPTPSAEPSPSPEPES